MSLKLTKLITTLLGRFEKAKVSFTTTTERLRVELSVQGPKRLSVVCKSIDLFDVGRLEPEESEQYWEELLEDFIVDMEAAFRRPSVSEMSGVRKAAG